MELEKFCYKIEDNCDNCEDDCDKIEVNYDNCEDNCDEIEDNCEPALNTSGSRGEAISRLL